MPVTSERELSSWKAIAAHLGVGVRTAQDWERTRGLPVRRLPGPRSPVRASIGELDAWKNTTTAPDAPLSPVPTRRLRWAVAGLGGIVVLTTGFLWFLPGAPVSYRVERNSLVVLDARGRECWRTQPADINTEAYAHRDLVWMGKLGGVSSVLFAVAPARADGESPLICYGKDGRERWRFTPGRAVRTRNEAFRGPFDVHQVLVGPLGRDGKTRVLVVSSHYLYYPCQVALLDENGRVLREYWHSGHFDHALVTDRGRHVLVAGVNNATKMATLVSLDPDTMTGASREDNPDYQLQGFGPSKEVTRFLFPRSDINVRLEPYAIIDDLWDRDGEFTVVVNHRIPPRSAAVYYHLNHDLTLREMVVASGFTQMHAELFANRVLDHALDERETEALRMIRLGY